jgi:hypothetical protein
MPSFQRTFRFRMPFPEIAKSPLGNDAHALLYQDPNMGATTRLREVGRFVESVKFPEAIATGVARTKREGDRLGSDLSPFYLFFFSAGGRVPLHKEACEIERTFAGAAGPHPASEGGKPELTKAPRSRDSGCGNFGGVPLQSAVVGVPRQA